MNNSWLAHRQVLIKKSGRTIERLAPNSEVVNLKCFSIQVAFIYPFIQTNKKKQLTGQQARPRHPENSKQVTIFSRCLVILYQPFSGTKGLKPTCDTRSIHLFRLFMLAWTKKKPKKPVHLQMRNLMQTELQRLKDRGKKG